ncbi:MAG: OmpH family outer membrane protein [Puniceicoccales bacterium]|nr:OmpH family outer membrane protein [Puniceicoccales bacterium]
MKKLVIFMGALGSGLMCLLAFDSTAKKDNSVAETAKFSQEIGIVHSLKITGEYYRIRKLNETLSSEFNAAQKELLSMANEFQKMGGEYEKLLEESQNPALTEEAKKKRKVQADEKLEILRQKELAIRDFKTNSENRITKTKMDEGSKISTMIKQKMKDVAKEKGISLLFDADNPVLFYAADSLDVTDSVIAVLNADQPKSEIQSKPKGEETATAAAPVKK